MIELKNTRQIEIIEKIGDETIIARKMRKEKFSKTEYPDYDRLKESIDFSKKHDTIIERVKSIIKYDKSARKGKNSYLWLLMVYYTKCNMIKIIVPLEDFYKATPPASIERARRELYMMAKKGDESLKWLLDDKEFLEEMNKEEEICHNYYQDKRNSEIAKHVK